MITRLRGKRVQCLRKGIQPVVPALANGGAKAIVTARQSVSFTGSVEAPPGTGKIVWAAWDFDGSRNFAHAATLPKSPSAKVFVKASHSFDKPGTYFVTLKAGSERRGNTTSPFAHIVNLARVRVVVE